MNTWFALDLHIEGLLSSVQEICSRWRQRLWNEDLFTRKMESFLCLVFMDSKLLLQNF